MGVRGVCFASRSEYVRVLDKVNNSPPELRRPGRHLDFTRILAKFPNSWYNYRVLIGYFRESHRGPQNLVPAGTGTKVPRLFLTTV